ncbi:phage holin family protein [Micromonospora sp. WMMD998]|uniref:phage holin family protein n=1 Tax=Micromonospora sp. WMMD998 TaxID=3016092 RepID=UPI00249B8028|nr:phage holin family protein [Micromonospora sp. WMMD998]WFE39820.1 phage holin family protein [Micromonospora sp. WMMD998]
MSDGTVAGDGRRSPTERLAEDVAEVVRAEVRAVRAQVGEAARPAGVGIALLAAAGGCLVLGAGSASTTVLRVLETMLPRRLAAASLTAGYLVTAVLLGRVGLARLRAAGGPSARLADDVRDMVTGTAGRVLPAGAEAARDELDR